MKNNNQFFYTRAFEEKQYRDSFNVNKVIRTITNTDGTVIVLLDDFNERTNEKPILNKQGVITGYKNVKETVHSEIFLSAEDGKRFFNLTNVELL